MWLANMIHFLVQYYTNAGHSSWFKTGKFSDWWCRETDPSRWTFFSDCALRSWNIDFGIARVKEEEMTNSPGTRQYRAIETISFSRKPRQVYNEKGTLIVPLTFSYVWMGTLLKMAYFILLQQTCGRSVLFFVRWSLAIFSSKARIQFSLPSQYVDPSRSMYWTRYYIHYPYLPLCVVREKARFCFCLSSSHSN